MRPLSGWQRCAAEQPVGEVAQELLAPAIHAHQTTNSSAGGRPLTIAKAADAYVGAGHQELASPLRPSIVEELRWFFERQRTWSESVSEPASDAARYQQARLAFNAPRFRALYRAWLREGSRALDATVSPVLADAIHRGTGRIECHVLPRAYLHLSPLVSTA